MKAKLFTTLLTLLIIGSAATNAQSYFEDTVWTKKTDQTSGFYQVKFSNNDSIIVGHGYENAIFYNAFDGEEIARIPERNEVFYFNDDNNFIQLSDTRNCFEIFDAKTYLVIDTLENDGIKLYPTYTLTKDESKLVCVKSGGLRTWDMETKKILNSKEFPSPEGLTSIKVHQIFPNCNDNEIILNVEKVYLIKESPPEYQSIVRNIFYDINTLDSVNTFRYNPFRLSHNCNYFAVMTPRTTDGVEIYDFNTKQLMHKLPVNGPSLRVLEFSPDDKYLVTNPNIMIWNVQTGENTYVYTSGSTNCLDVSHDGKYLFSSVGRYIYKWHARFGNTSTPEENQNISLIYPNPTTGEVNINLTSHTLKDVIESVRLFDVLGIERPATSWHFSAEGNLKIDVSSLPNGEYIIVIEGNKESRSYKLIINR